MFLVRIIENNKIDAQLSSGQLCPARLGMGLGKRPCRVEPPVGARIKDNTNKTYFYDPKSSILTGSASDPENADVSITLQTQL